MKQLFGGEEIPYAKFGLARVALARGERNEACQIAKEVLDYLLGTSHKLEGEIRKFLADPRNFPSL